MKDRQSLDYLDGVAIKDGLAIRFWLGVIWDRKLGD